MLSIVELISDEHSLRSQVGIGSVTMDVKGREICIALHRKKLISV